MFLTKNAPTSLRNNLSLVAIGTLTVIGLTQIVTTPSAIAANTQIRTHICQGGPKTPTITATNPANQATVQQQNINLVVTTDWTTKLVAKLNGVIVFNQAINYQAGVNTIIPLSQLLPEPQSNHLELTITGGCPEASSTQQLTIKFKANILTFQPLQTNQHSPRLTGKINDLTAKVKVTVNSQTYTAINNGDGSWTLPSGAIQPLANGHYDVQITFKDAAGNTSSITDNIVIAAANNLGFILVPNTGFLRLGHINIPSWLLYLLILTPLAGYYFRRHQHRTSSQ